MEEYKELKEYVRKAEAEEAQQEKESTEEKVTENSNESPAKIKKSKEEKKAEIAKQVEKEMNGPLIDINFLRVYHSILYVENFNASNELRNNGYRDESMLIVPSQREHVHLDILPYLFSGTRDFVKNVMNLSVATSGFLYEKRESRYVRVLLGGVILADNSFRH